MALEASADHRMFPAFGPDQRLGIYPEGSGNPLHPFERQIAHPCLEPADRLRGRRRDAGFGEFGEGHSLALANVADAVDHLKAPFNRNGDFSFLQHMGDCKARVRLMHRRTLACSASLSNAN